MRITSADWERLSRLLDEALDLEPAKRAQWVGSLGPEYADLRDTLQEILLGGDAIETDDFLNGLPPFSALPGITIKAGDSLGPYRLIRELGSGGTAVVWLAERADGTLQRRVAIKFPHIGLVDRGLSARLARERDILATLEHPSIARLYDAGADERGRSYLVLEYIDGIPPDRFCAERDLTIRQRLELFLRIASPVVFAHARLIVHRDLKPTNILVLENGEVRLLDFGIARLLQGDDAAAFQQTQIGARAFTPSYAAPEQFTNQAVTVATDVYSLGVILFELLSGHSPYSPTRKTLGALENSVIQDEPRVASSLVAEREARLLRGDLDTILGKALKKAPDERYASVEAFAADVERHLSGLPITARPQSIGYVSRKFAKRHAIGLALTGVVVVALAASLGLAAWQWKQATAQRAVAIDRLANAQASGDFIAAILIERLQPGESVTFEELIRRSEVMANETGRNDLRARIFATDFLAGWYMANGYAEKAEEHLTRTIGSLPKDDIRKGSLLRCRRATAWQQLGRGAEARDALTAEIARTADDPATQAQCLLARAWLAQGFHDAPGALEFSLAAQRQSASAGVESVFDKASILETIGRAHAMGQRTDLAQDYYRASLKVFADAGRTTSRAAAQVHQSWAAMCLEFGNPLCALEHLDATIAINKTLAPRVKQSEVTLGNRARALVQLHRFPEAMEQFEVASQLASSRGNTLSLAAIAVGRADIATSQGEFTQAHSYLDEAGKALQAKSLPVGHTVGARYLMAKAELSAAKGNLGEAAGLLTDAIAAYEKLSCCYGQIALGFTTRAEVAGEGGRLDLAATDVARALEAARLAQAKEPFSAYTGRALEELAVVKGAQGMQRESADAYRLAVTHFAKTLGENHPDTMQAHAALGQIDSSKH